MDEACPMWWENMTEIEEIMDDGQENIKVYARKYHPEYAIVTRSDDGCVKTVTILSNGKSNTWEFDLN